MDAIQLKLAPDGKGAFVLENDNEQLAEMVIGITGNELAVYHTEVAEKLKGQGVAGKLLEKMVAYAREKNLQVNPLCPYVHAQFRKHSAQYADVWKQT